MGKQKQDSHHGNQKLDVINRGKKWRMRQMTAVLKTLNAISLGGTGGNRQNDQQEVQFSSVQSLSCDPVNCSTPGLPVHHQLPEFTQTHVH